LAPPDPPRHAKIYERSARFKRWKGSTDDAVSSHGLHEATVSFIQKPFGPLQLAKKLREVLGQDSS
jgi:hypothetical protein